MVAVGKTLAWLKQIIMLFVILDTLKCIIQKLNAQV